MVADAGAAPGIATSGPRGEGTSCYGRSPMASPPTKKLRWDRILLLLVVLAAIGVGVYFVYTK